MCSWTPQNFPAVYAQSLDDITRLIAEVYRDTGSRWWFRGHLDANWELLPKIWRGYDPQTERYLTNLFYQRAKLRHASFPPDDDYAGWLALMQHYGLPTRLLDWSQSVLIAAYFATASEPNAANKQNVPGDAAIWMLNPSALNAAQGYPPVFPSLNAGSLRLMIRQASKENPFPEYSDQMVYDVLAAVPINHDLRMLMQQGTFTVHTTPQPLTMQPSCESWLRKVIIPGNYVRSIAVELDILGVHMSDVYPDLEHLARELMAIHRPRPT